MAADIFFRMLLLLENVGEFYEPCARRRLSWGGAGGAGPFDGTGRCRPVPTVLTCWFACDV
ncbi:hypothetical protein GCM10018785_32850 [Streptomyces longispororuber]|uniref:Uncharacterized protein n=2 Tax=Streptomyces longispororuber TaxID=68230 RepID=A0A918ZMX3_9ACTN|nr:hypothetical protein GCM10018785_32850 [Streptomyces longispororuber]